MPLLWPAEDILIMRLENVLSQNIPFWKNPLGESRMKHYLDRTIKREKSIVERT
jgi:hypothetical protein